MIEGGTHKAPVETISTKRRNTPIVKKYNGNSWYQTFTMQLVTEFGSFEPRATNEFEWFNFAEEIQKSPQPQETEQD